MRSILLFLLCTQALACSIFMRSIERPQAKVREVSVSSAGLTGVTGQLALDVTNPNNVGVPLSGIDWQLSVGGARAVTGRAELSQTIPARGVAPVTTSLTIDARDAVAVVSALASGARDYQLVASLHFSTAVGQLDVEVQQRGTLGGDRRPTIDFGLMQSARSAEHGPKTPWEEETSGGGGGGGLFGLR